MYYKPDPTELPRMNVKPTGGSGMFVIGSGFIHLGGQRPLALRTLLDRPGLLFTDLWLANKLSEHYSQITIVPLFYGLKSDLSPSDSGWGIGMLTKSIFGWVVPNIHFYPTLAGTYFGQTDLAVNDLNTTINMPPNGVRHGSKLQNLSRREIRVLQFLLNKDFVNTEISHKLILDSLWPETIGEDMTNRKGLLASCMHRMSRKLAKLGLKPRLHVKQVRNYGYELVVEKSLIDEFHSTPISLDAKTDSNY